MIYSNTDFVALLTRIATEYNTSYIWGGIGSPITEASLQRAVNAYSKNRTSGYADAARRYLGNGFHFDCVGLIKSVLWGWDGSASKTYGGATYASNGVPDYGANQLFNLCSERSADFCEIVPGEAVWLNGHIGVYIGDGLAVECTPAWKNGVQITAVKNIGTRSGYNSRRWTTHGKLPWIGYGAVSGSQTGETAKPTASTTKTYNVALRLLVRGTTGEDVKSAQTLLILRGYKLPTYGADGEIGAETEEAVKAFQRANSLEVDGKIGGETWKRLIGG